MTNQELLQALVTLYQVTRIPVVTIGCVVFVVMFAWATKRFLKKSS